MKRHFMFAFLLVTVMLAESAHAQTTQTDFNLTLDRVGVSKDVIYFSVVEGFGLDCQYGVIMFSHAETFAKATYAQLLTAKITGKKIYRLVYDQSGGPGSPCIFRLVELKE